MTAARKSSRSARSARSAGSVQSVQLGPRRPLAVIALGGNALWQPNDRGTVEEQQRRAEDTAAGLVRWVRQGYNLLIVHGNGPQVGQVLIRSEAAAEETPRIGLDMAVASTQGSMGYLLELALRNQLGNLGRISRLPQNEGSAGGGVRVGVSSLLSMVVVDPDDAGFAEPTKPIGPFVSEKAARKTERELGWTMKKDPNGNGWRKVVASPRPIEVLNADAMADLLTEPTVLIAGGGGGVPVVRRQGGSLEGVEAVIDKDHTATLLARTLGAEMMVILTSVPAVRLHFGTPEERTLPRMDLNEARHWLAEGEFPAGSMGPKIEAAIEFVAATGRKVLITDTENLDAALEGRAGTKIVPGTPLSSSEFLGRGA